MKGDTIIIIIIALLVSIVGTIYTIKYGPLSKITYLLIFMILAMVLTLIGGDKK